MIRLDDFVSQENATRVTHLFVSGYLVPKPSSILGVVSGATGTLELGELGSWRLAHFDSTSTTSCHEIEALIRMYKGAH